MNKKWILSDCKGRFGFSACGSSHWSVPPDGTSWLYREDVFEDQKGYWKKMVSKKHNESAFLPMQEPFMTLIEEN
ncbi:MAG: hypothetical protein RLO09_22635 [Cyclobacteriaceae bacterium]